MNRVEAFLSSQANDAFHSVEHKQEIWKVDPFDVESIHAEARAEFERLLLRAQQASAGRVLLLLGESGSGKTHLVRAFRNHTHRSSRGFVGYLQMTTKVKDYARYVLSNLLESLDQPYYDALESTTGLMRLSTVIANRADGIEIAKLQAEELSDDEVAESVYRATDSVLQRSDWRHLDIDLIRALLFLQRDDPRIAGRVRKYLLCEELSPADRQFLGGMPSRTSDDAPERVIEFFGKLLGGFNYSLVLCVDQLEDMFNFTDAEQNFRRMIQNLIGIADRVPRMVIVVSCLDQYWEHAKAQLTRSQLDRLVNDPPPQHLEGTRTPEEATLIVQKRLRWLFDQTGADVDPQNPVAPIPERVLHARGKVRTRDLLTWCQRYRAEWRKLGRAPEPDVRAAREQKPPAPPAPEQNPALSQLWNDFRSAFRTDAPTDEAQRTRLIAEALDSCRAELPAGCTIASRLHRGGIEVETAAPGGVGESLFVVLCDKNAQGGGLEKQVLAAASEHKNRKPVFLRSSPFDQGAKTKVAKTIGELIVSRDARRAEVTETDYRTVLALRSFAQTHAREPEYAAWLKEEQPLTQLPSFTVLLNTEALHRASRAAVPPIPVAQSTGEHPQSPAPAALPLAPSSEVENPSLATPIIIGRGFGISPQPLQMEPGALTQHAAFLGGTGSGKTSLAMLIIEQLLARAVPAILVDRKGDLASYASPAAWNAEGRGADERRRLRERLAINLFTPGSQSGRPLVLPLLPELAADTPRSERDEVLQASAGALASSLGYRDANDPKRVLLQLGLQVLVEHEVKPTLDSLLNLIDQQDPSLVHLARRFEQRHFRRLTEDLETFRLNRADRLLSGADTLDMGELLRPTAIGKTPLTIVSTKFLGDNDAVQFWMTQFLTQISRWVGRNPAKKLQAVLMLDEADQYLPAVGKPPTKEPMENLLRRARSAGLGVFLATQSPGDFDYRCRDQILTWFVGRVTQEPALRKLRPLLSDAAASVEARLPRQEVGEFHLLRGAIAKQFKANRGLLNVDQLPETELLGLSKATAGAGR